MSTCDAAANAATFTDLYGLTMAAAYHAEALEETATFELWVRRLPPQRRFLVVAGLETALSHLESFRFDAAAIEALRGLGRFSASFLERLAGLRFSGDVWAMPEGTLAFAGEPLLRISAPILEAQLLETFLLNAIGFQTLIASKAARVTLAAAGRPWIDFGARRAHGGDAARLGARAACIAGAAATSLVPAGLAWGLPLSGTMAHAYVLAHASELEAFVAFARSCPEDAVFLVDTHDTLQGVAQAIEATAILAAEGITVRGIRIDSGDLASLAWAARRLLDGAGLQGLQILVSGGLDEQDVAALVASGAPIDGFGVGTRLLTSHDCPSLDVIYKLVHDRQGPRRKTSAGKETLPDAKQVYRFCAGGRFHHDILALAAEPVPAGAEPLLQHQLRAGRRLRGPEPLAMIRDRLSQGLVALPDQQRGLAEGAEEAYPVLLSPALQELTERMELEMRNSCRP